MPSFYPDAYSRRLAVTPQEYDSVYAVGRNGDIQGPMSLPYASQASMMAPYEKDAHEYLEPYNHHRASFAAPGPLNYSHQSVMPPNYDVFHLPKPAPQPPMYSSAEAPVMPPPIRYNDRVPVDDPSAQRYRGLQDARSKVEAPKTEKAVVGGVAAYLDYEMDQMSEFVSEMAQGIVQPGLPVSPAFRKFVSQVLSSTRLPSSTILLGLYYLNTRMTMLSKEGQHKTCSGQVYRMLTISLLLGSKFLDDNTFQNRSWSEVSGLAVSELNTLERDWLADVEWDLHIDLVHHAGYRTISDHWTAWKRKVAARTLASQLPPIDTSIQRRRYSRQQDISPPSGYAPGYPKQLPFSGTAESHPSQYPPPARFDKGNWAYTRSMLEYSPPSAPETGPPTPDYQGYGGPWVFNPPPPPYSLHHPTHGPVALPTYPQSSYSQCFAPSIWSNHTTGCACAHCNRAHEPYFMAPAHGPQPVAG